MTRMPVAPAMAFYSAGIPQTLSLAWLPDELMCAAVLTARQEVCHGVHIRFGGHLQMMSGRAKPPEKAMPMCLSACQAVLQA